MFRNVYSKLEQSGEDRSLPTQNGGQTEKHTNKGTSDSIRGQRHSTRGDGTGKGRGQREKYSKRRAKALR